MISENIGKSARRQPFFHSLIPVVAANTLISMAISLPLVRVGVSGGGALAVAAGVVAFISHYFLLNFLIAVPLYLLTRYLPSGIAAVVAIVLSLLVQTVLLIDTRIYTIFHYHINSLVWNVITTEGVTDSVIYGKGTVLVFILLTTLILAAEIVIHLKLGRIYRRLAPQRLAAFARAARICFGVCLALVVLDKGLYAYADIFNETAITKNVKLYPLYQPFTVKRFASSVLHVKINREASLKLPASSASLRYPREQLQFDQGKNRRYNIIVIALEGLRSDMLDREIMPNLWSFSRDNIVYANHYSGGNGSRFGIFSLLYGIDGTYWHNFLAVRQSPVLIDSLMKEHYAFTILSSTRLTFPEFRKTAFVRIPESIGDSFATDYAPERDRIIADKLIGTISSGTGPFFAFVFFNSSHQPYLYPQKFEKFRPVGGIEINYFEDTGRQEVSLLRNRYKNALFYDDSLLGKIIASLKAAKILDRTVLVVTGDHGEEFYENGSFGHTSSFDDYQTKTVFVMHYPGVGGRVVNRLTSHMDLVPTLMTSLGCTSPPGLYSEGLSLVAEKEHPYIVVANWDSAAIVDKETKIIFSTELYNAGAFEIRRKDDYAPVEDRRAVTKKKGAILIDASSKMAEFYR